MHALILWSFLLFHVFALALPQSLQLTPREDKTKKTRLVCIVLFAADSGQKI